MLSGINESCEITVQASGHDSKDWDLKIEKNLRISVTWQSWVLVRVDRQRTETRREGGVTQRASLTNLASLTKLLTGIFLTRGP